MLSLSACAGISINASGGGATPTTAPNSAAQVQPTATPPALSTTPTVSGIDPHTLLNKNLIVNGDAEAGPGSATDETLVAIPGWTRQGDFNVVQYQTTNGGFQTKTSPGPSDRGNNYFFGGPNLGASGNNVTSASQTIDLSALTPLLSNSQIKFTLSAWLGGYSSQNDNAKLTIQFLSASGQTLGSASLGPVLAADRSNTTGLIARSTTGTLPTGTARVTVTLTMTKLEAGDNDGSADNLSLMLHP